MWHSRHSSLTSLEVMWHSRHSSLTSLDVITPLCVPRTIQYSCRCFKKQKTLCVTLVTSDVTHSRHSTHSIGCQKWSWIGLSPLLSGYPKKKMAASEIYLRAHRTRQFYIMARRMRQINLRALRAPQILIRVCHQCIKFILRRVGRVMCVVCVSILSARRLRGRVGRII